MEASLKLEISHLTPLEIFYENSCKKKFFTNFKYEKS